MARFSSRLPEALWIVIGLVGMGVAGILYGLSTSIPLAIVLVMITGFFNSPSSGRSFRAAPAPHATRDARARVLGVLRHARHHLPDRDGRSRPCRRRRHPPAHRRGLIPAVRVCGLRAGGSRSRLGTLRAARTRLRESEGAPAFEGTPLRPATAADFGRVAVQFRPSPGWPTISAMRSCVARPIRDVPAGTRVVEHGDVASIGVLHPRRTATAGIPDEGGYRGLSTMSAGDFFGEIAALTGSPRTADVIADTDRRSWRSRPIRCGRRWSCLRSGRSSSRR